jgi:hypothetical protein
MTAREADDLPTSTEFGVEWKTFLDGEYDRSMITHPLFRTPLTEGEAREEVDNMQRAGIPARLISRQVTDWEAAE